MKGAGSSENTKRRRIAVVASDSRSLVNFRFHLIKAIVDAGHEVVAFAPERDDEVTQTLTTIGARFVPIPMERTGVSLWKDLRTFGALCYHFLRSRPDTLLPYTMKPVIYASLAGQLARVPHRFALITGLGYVFTDPNPTKRVAALRRLSILLYRLSLAGAQRVFVYNEDDIQEMCRQRMIANPRQIVCVPGSGVDLDHYVRSDPPSGPVTFLLIARLLRDKGILEYLEAARTIRQRFSTARIQLLGPHDPNPSAIPRSFIEKVVADGTIEYLGETRDVRPFLAQCTVFVLPSYREGVPRTVLEAMATGRAIITTDAPGCRDTVDPGQNGVLVPPRDAAALAEAMESFLVDPSLAHRMGWRSYDMARERFDVHAINRQILSNMQLI